MVQSAVGRTRFAITKTTHFGALQSGAVWRTLSATSIALPPVSQFPRPREWRDHTVFSVGGLEFARRDDSAKRQRVAHYAHVRGWSLVLPYWFHVLATAVPAVVGLRVAGYLLRRRRRLAGLCPACGYDLRATPARCPECGAAVTLRETAA